MIDPKLARATLYHPKKPRSPSPTLDALGVHTPYTRVSIANEHRAGSRGAAPEENYRFAQFIWESYVSLRR